MRQPLALTLAFALAAAPAATSPAGGEPKKADESQIVLKDGPGKDLVVANCVICHSLDYIPMNSVFLDRKGWEASVTKMIKVMGAPVAPEDVKQIVDYLAENYGKK